MQLFFAGGEAWADLLLSMGVKNQLFSYYYFRTMLRSSGPKARTLLARMRMAKAKGYRFMLDSGAFTYQTKAKTGNVPPAEAYFKEYYDFCLENGDLFEMIAEFDIDGVEHLHDPKTDKPWTPGQIDEWTNSLLDIPSLAPRVLPVYRTSRGDRWLTDWLLDPRSPLLGFSSSILEGTGAVIAKAHRYGKFVHGFGQTRIKTDLKYTPFDSVDSTTWLRADKYGGTCIFQNGKFIVLDHLHKAQRRSYRKWYESWGLDFALIAKDDLEENRKATIIAWREMATSFERKWFVTGGKYPYLYQRRIEGRPALTEHPLVTIAKRDSEHS